MADPSPYPDGYLFRHVRPRTESTTAGQGPAPQLMETFFATCPRGLEEILARELAVLGAPGARAVPGGAGFSGRLETCYRANLESRIASRVLWRVGAERYVSEHDIYQAARRLTWGEWFGPDQTLRVDLAAIRSPLRSLEFATLRIKD